MCFRRAGKPTKNKKIIYLAASVVLGALLSAIAHGLVEMAFLNWTAANGRTAQFYHGCALWPALQAGILLAGIIGGFFLGKLWWRVIYVERKWERKNRPLTQKFTKSINAKI